MKMKNSGSFSSEVWLLSGIINSLPGILTLESGKLIFLALGTGTFWKRGLKKIEKKAGAENFTSLLNLNKPAQLFSIELSEIQKISFPAIYFSAGVNINFNNEKYRLSFIQPNNTKMPNVERSDYQSVVNNSIVVIKDISHARKIGKRWKSLLIE